MCDTVVATAEATADRSVVFAKNSDREPGEAQAVELLPAAEHAGGGSVRCTYVAVPQVSRTHGVLLCRPHWMWGAEMGANDQGVVIGNEAVFTRVPQQDVALLGMDLLRLALERSASAVEAVDRLGALLEEHGQGGPAGHRHKRTRYHNSFIVADPEDAWVVETADRMWVAERVRGVRSISNGLTIGERWDRGSAGIEARARDLGLWQGKGPFDFAKAFSDPTMTFGAAARQRRSCTEGYLSRRKGEVTPALAMQALRQHGGSDRNASRGVFMTVCSHASWLPTRSASQTTGSLVSHLTKTLPTHFVTATSAPCTSLFKPVWFDSGLPSHGPTPGDRFDPDALWWRHELLHRLALGDLPGFLARFAPERDALERRFLRDAAERARAGVNERRRVTLRSFRDADDFDEAWRERLQRGGAPPPAMPGPLYARFWRRLDRLSGMTR